MISPIIKVPTMCRKICLFQVSQMFLNTTYLITKARSNISFYQRVLGPRTKSLLKKGTLNFLLNHVHTCWIKFLIARHSQKRCFIVSLVVWKPKHFPSLRHRTTTFSLMGKIPSITPVTNVLFCSKRLLFQTFVKVWVHLCSRLTTPHIIFGCVCQSFL